MRLSRRWARAAPWTALAVTVTLLALWRIVCVRAGPDVDSDAYGHHGIARQILADPTDLSVHWVWLPLFHYLQVALVALGGTMQAVRYANVAVTIATPLLLFAYLAPRESGGVPLLAGLLASFSAIVMQMGTTAQPEPLFSLLVLAFVVAYESRRYALASALLAAAALLRYEVWAVPFALAAWLVLCRIRGRAVPRRAWLSVAAPLVAILAWAALRRPVDGAWFGFLKETRAFANDATKATSSLSGGAGELARDLVYYAALVPWRTSGPGVLLAPFGILRAWRRAGPVFVLTYLACLGFLTLSWIMRSSLGLDRHFVSVVPFYATLMAAGAAELGEGAARLLVRLGAGARLASVARDGSAALLGGAALVAGWLLLDGWMASWRASIEHGWPERVAVGRFLQTLPPSATIFCDDATVEILSGLDRRRFDRHWVDDPTEPGRVEETAEHDGVAYVATWMRKLKRLDGMGEIVFRTEEGENGEASLGVMRVAAK
jgi:NADH:ubiquinone oxidoreductase subunit 6 (subunit J)